MRPSLVLALCVISAAIGAAIDHYWDEAFDMLRPKQTENVDTRHRWLDILPALGRAVPIPA
jgi:hypothetical protein